MSPSVLRAASRACLVAAIPAIAYAAIALAGPAVARVTMRPHPGRDAIEKEKPPVARMPSLDALAALEGLEVRDARSIERASELVAAGMVHYWPSPGDRDPAIECRFIEHPELAARIRKLAWSGENPAALAGLRRDERSDWRTALRLGVGYCSQQSLVLAGYLRERGVKAVAMGLGGHVVATAETPEGEWVLDPDYGVVIRRPLEALEREPDAVRAAYLAAGYPAERAELLASIFGPEGNAEHSGGAIGTVSPRQSRQRTAAAVAGLVALAASLLLGRRARDAERAAREPALHRDAA